MISKVRQSLGLLNQQERTLVIFLAVSRALLGLLDIAGIFLIGLLLAKGANQIADGGNINLDFVSSLTARLDIMQIASLAVVLFLSKSVLASILMKYMAIQTAHAEGRIATQVYSGMLASPISKVSKYSQSEITFSLTYSAGSAITQLIATAVTIFSESFLLIFVVAFFAFVDLELTLYILVYFLIIGLLIYRTIGTQFGKVGKKYSSSMISTSATVEDSLVAFREIFTLEKQNDFRIHFSEARSELAESTASINYLSGLPRYIVESALMVGAMGLAIFTLNSSDPASAPATLGIFLTGGFRIMASMLPLQNSLGNLKQLMAQAESFVCLAKDFQYVPNELEIQAKEKSANNGFEPIGVRLNNISYTYESSENYAIKDVTLTVPKGQMVAFIGQSGSGKSTLADLIVGLLSPDTGTVDLENAEFRNIGYVPQSPGIIHGTITQNITLNFGKSLFDQVRLNNALLASHLLDLVGTLENGVDTDLGAQSDGLSGGQLQRIGLARAIYANPGLLVLDEATSALDAETEAAVSDSLRTLRGKCTTIVIAHRLTTIQNADIIFVFDQGEVVASGKFADLVKTNDLVARFVELSTLEITS